jgi:glycosidase
MTVPYWVQDAVFYQIFPDRFANGDPSNDPPNVKAWGSPPTIWDFQGGDLRGVIQRLDYLLDLGVNAIYLNPIFQATSTHRYNTSDYFQIDPKLGTLADFRALLDAAHRNGMRVIIDGVFNHCGRGFFAFADLLENGEHSPYKDWFHVKKFPLDAYGHGDIQEPAEIQHRQFRRAAVHHGRGALLDRTGRRRLAAGRAQRDRR